MHKAAAHRIVHAFATVERVAIGGLMASIVILTLVQVIWRYALNQPLQWSEEVARYCFVWATLLGAAAQLRLRDGHPRIDSLGRALGPRVQAALDAASRALVIACCIAIAFGGLRMMQLYREQSSPSLEIPMTWVYFSLVVGPLVGVFWTVWCGSDRFIEDDA